MTNMLVFAVALLVAGSAAIDVSFDTNNATQWPPASNNATQWPPASNNATQLPPVTRSGANVTQSSPPASNNVTQLPPVTRSGNVTQAPSATRYPTRPPAPAANGTFTQKQCVSGFCVLCSSHTFPQHQCISANGGQASVLARCTQNFLVERIFTNQMSKLKEFAKVAQYCWLSILILGILVNSSHIQFYRLYIQGGLAALLIYTLTLIVPS